ncbi:MAG: type-F conjugative transfer system pilin assembly protein TrbC [Sphingobium sp.]
MACAQSTSSGAKAKIEAQSDAAAIRLKDATAAQEADNGKTAPPAPPPPDPEMHRRAFEAMKSRVAAPQMDARARAALEAGRAELDRERDAMAKRLGEALGLEAPDMQALAKGAMSSAKPGWVPVLFVSSSMPVAVLRTYAAQLEKARGVMAFRGMPGGLTTVGPMAKLSAQILRLDSACEGPACAMRNVQLIVDPIVFRQHGVTRVPALAMIPGDPTLPYCEREENSPRGAHIVYGDAALSGLLEEYGRLGGRKEVRDAQVRLDAR